jgi:hypothetical protein
MTTKSTTLLVCALLIFGLAPALAGPEEDNIYELNINPHAPIIGDLSSFGNFGYYGQNDTYSKYRFGWPSLLYQVSPWLQLIGGLDSYYTDNYQSTDTLELRPYGGVKLFVPNKTRITIYNYTRYEFRDTEDLDTHEWSSYSRIRSRFGVEFPLISRSEAYQPKTFYTLADVEPFYRFDTDEWDPLRVRGGLGYVLSDRIRLELIYTAEFDRSAPGSPLEWNNNTIELNIRIGFSKGLLGRLLNPE